MKPNRKALKNAMAMLFAVITLLNNPCHGQTDSTAHAPGRQFFAKSIAPAALMFTGTVLSGSRFEHNLQTEIRNRTGNDFYTPVDNYLQFAPVATLYIADIAGVKAKNGWFDQTKYLFISQVVSTGLVLGLKRITGKTRPDGGAHAFPSGHTASAFTSAAVLYNEFNGTSPIIAASGYALAGVTASLRVANNKHWVSDVLFGAGLGMLVTHIVYYYQPLKHFNPFKKSGNITLIPNLSEQEAGFYFSCRF